MITQEIRDKALGLNFDSCGFIAAAPFDEYARYLDKRVETFPDSKQYYERFYGFIDPPEGAKSIIVCIRRYNKYLMPAGLDTWIGKNYQFDGRLPYSREYRDKAEFEMFLTTKGINIIDAMVPDRWAAAKAGLGKFGWNNFIYDPDHGSYHYIYTWAVDKVLEYDDAPDDMIMHQCGEQCNKCVEACPTKAISGCMAMDMAKCAARLTNNSFTGEIPDENTMSQMNQLLYGCDICQDVCPHNADKFKEKEDFPLLDQYVPLLRLENILSMDQNTYEKVLNPRFWYTGPDGLWLWKCNALRSMVNSGDSAYYDTIREYRNHDDERLREVARWGCEKLNL